MSNPRQLKENLKIVKDYNLFVSLFHVVATHCLFDFKFAEIFWWTNKNFIEHLS